MSLSTLSKIRFVVAAYIGGRGVSWGTGELGGVLFPKLALDNKKYDIVIDPIKTTNSNVIDSDLDVIAPGVLDHVIVGPHIAKEANQKQALKLLIGKLRVGGHLTTIVKVEDFPADSLIQLLTGVGGWKQKVSDVVDGYLVGSYKKLPYKGLEMPIVSTGKTACIVRYGALGDMVILTPLIRQLAQDGYSVTMNITPYAAAVLENNPHITNIVLQDREIIPNPELGGYWNYWKEKYDRYINLSESIEGSLLKVEGRRDFYTTQRWRDSVCSKNYQDNTMALGGYPELTGQRGELYFSNAEKREAQKIRTKYQHNFLVLWALNGSSYHKVYGPAEGVAVEFLERHPNAIVITVGDERAKQIDFNSGHPRIISKVAKWNIREVMAMTSVVDCVVGPESALVNFASCFETPKIVFMSHSLPLNLTEYWLNCYPLEPQKTLAPCYPCHQLHYTRESCPLVRIADLEENVLAEGPSCTMGAIPEETVLETLERVYESQRRTA